MTIVSVKNQKDGTYLVTKDSGETEVTEFSREILLWVREGNSIEHPQPTQEQIRDSMIASPAQIRLTLFQLDLLDTVQTLADSDPQASLVWEYAAEIRRSNPLIAAIGSDGFTPGQIDDIFRYAMALEI